MRGNELLRWLARPVLAIVWAFVAWGNLLLAVTLWNAITGGPGHALALLVPDRAHALWGWLNVFATALAAALWLGAFATVAWRRRRKRRQAS